MASVAIEAGPPGVAVQEVKAYLRVEHGAEDALIAGLIRSAQGACEAFTGLVLIERAASAVLPAAPASWQRLGLSPVRSIEAVAALGAGGEETVFPAESYAVDVDAAGDGWVRVLQPGSAKRVRVRFTAGLAADWNGVPEPLRHGIVRLAAHLYGARGAAEGIAPPATVAALWRPWRRLRLA